MQRVEVVYPGMRRLVMLAVLVSTVLAGCAAGFRSVESDVVAPSVVQQEDRDAPHLKMWTVFRF